MFKFTKFKLYYFNLNNCYKIHYLVSTSAGCVVLVSGSGVLVVVAVGSSLLILSNKPPNILLSFWSCCRRFCFSNANSFLASVFCGSSSKARDSSCLASSQTSKVLRACPFLKKKGFNIIRLHF